MYEYWNDLFEALKAWLKERKGFVGRLTPDISPPPRRDD